MPALPDHPDWSHIVPGSPEHLEYLIDREVNRLVTLQRKTGRPRCRAQEQRLSRRLCALILANRDVVRSALDVDERRQDLAS